MLAILYNIRSMHNVGSMFRTADAAGLEKIYLCGFTPDPIDRFGKKRCQISKVALGAEEAIKWEHKKSTIRLIKHLKTNGYTIISAEQSIKSIQYYKIEKHIVKKSKIAVIFGNEVNGIPENILSISDLIVEIPTFGKKDSSIPHPYFRASKIDTYTSEESLNVSVSFGIIIFEILKDKILS